MSWLLNIDVDDLERAITFYTQALKLTLSRRFGTLGAELAGGPALVHLLVKPVGSQPTPHSADRRSYQRHWTPLHLDLLVDQIEAEVQRITALGARLEQPISTHNWGRLALMADPFGHGFCLVQMLGRGYDAVADQVTDES